MAYLNDLTFSLDYLASLGNFLEYLRDFKMQLIARSQKRNLVNGTRLFWSK